MRNDLPIHIRVTIAAGVLLAIVCGFILLRDNGGAGFAWFYFLVCAAVSGLATFSYWRSLTVRTVGVLTGLSTLGFFLVTLFSPSTP